MEMKCVIIALASISPWLAATSEIAAAAEPLWEARTYDVLPISARAETGDEASSRQMTLGGQWDLAEAPAESGSALGDLDKLSWTHIEMPDAIQHALFLAGKTDNPWYGDNYKKLQWIAERNWYLRRRFRIPGAWQGRHIRLRFDGLNYAGAVWLDGRFLGVHEGMFGGPTLDVTALLGAGREHVLVVRLIAEKDPSRSMKSKAMEGVPFLWGNKFRTMGLYQPVRLVSSGAAYMEAPCVRTEAIGEKTARLWAQATIIHTGAAGLEGTIRAQIVDLTTGRIIWKEDARQAVPAGTSYWERSIEISDPKLWWPVGLGAQPLYRLELALDVGGQESDRIVSRFGIRTVELLRNPYLADKPRANPGKPDFMSATPKIGNPASGMLWGRPDLWCGDHPVEDDALHNADESYRFLFAVNGRPLFIKGASWMTSDDLLVLSPQREDWLVRAARFAGLNLFRLNGANNIFETGRFYDLCDENGILVWQELQFSFDRGSKVPLRTWREQLKQSVLRLRQHPSLALYVGGNEYAPYVEALAPYLGIAREIIAAYDNRPFRMSSPGGGTYHAYYTPGGSFADLWIGDPNWYARYFDESVNFVSEWSLMGYGNMSMMKRVIPREELAGGPVGNDCAKFAQAHLIMHSSFPEVERALPLLYCKASIYGNLARADLSDFVEYSQMALADVYGCVFEQWRAQFPYKGGQIVWTYNTHGPISSWNIIDWFGQPLIAYYSTKRADEPVHVMADTGFFTWGPGDTFKPSVFALNDASEPLREARVTARILDRHMQPVVTESWRLTVPAGGRHSEARQLQWPIPADTPEGCFFLELTLKDAAGHQLSRRAYWLRVVQSLADAEARKRWQAGAVREPLATQGPWLKPQLEGVPTTLSAEVTSREASATEARLTLVVKNAGKAPAYPVRIALLPDTCSTVWSDNYFWLAPGESTTVTGLVRLDMRGLDPLSLALVARASDLKVEVSAWNAKGFVLTPK